VFFAQHKRLNLVLQQAYVFHGRVKVDVDLHLLAHCLRPRNILDPTGVQHHMRNLDNLMVVHPLEDRIEQSNMFDGEMLVVDVNTIANIVRVLHEEEDAGP
jgi:hypothetical protein